MHLELEMATSNVSFLKNELLLVLNTHLFPKEHLEYYAIIT